MVSFSINRPGIARDCAAPPESPAPVPTPGKVRSPRRRVLISGQFQSLTSTHNVAIRNLSCTGAAIVCDAPLKVGAEGVLIAPHLDRLGRIVWGRGKAYGFQFDEQLPNALVLELHRITADDIARAESIETREWFQHQAR